MTFDKMNNKQAILLYLKDKIIDGKKFFKSHKIGRDLGISSKQVGAILYMFSTKPEITKLKIIKYAQSNSTTWLIEKFIQSKEVIMEEQNETV